MSTKVSTKAIAPKARVRLPKEERIKEILAAAREVFSQHGYDDAVMAEIAARVGVVEGALYRHFDNKRDLLNRILSDFYVELIEDVEQRLPGIKGTRNRLHFLIWRQLTAFADDPGYCWLVVSEVRPDKPFYQSAVHQFNRRYTSFAIHVIEEGIASGEFRADVSPLLVRDMMYGAIEHLMWRHLLSETPVDVLEQADTITDLVIRGITTAGEAETAPDILTDKLSGLVGRLESVVDSTERIDEP